MCLKWILSLQQKINNKLKFYFSPFSCIKSSEFRLRNVCNVQVLVHLAITDHNTGHVDIGVVTGHWPPWAHMRQEKWNIDQTWWWCYFRCDKYLLFGIVRWRSILYFLVPICNIIKSIGVFLMALFGGGRWYAAFSIFYSPLQFYTRLRFLDSLKS